MTATFGCSVRNAPLLNHLSYTAIFMHLKKCRLERRLDLDTLLNGNNNDDCHDEQMQRRYCASHIMYRAVHLKYHLVGYFHCTLAQTERVK